jgi:hypothetical protein
MRIRPVLSGVTRDELEDVLLVVNELVSNAYDHESSPRRLTLYRSAQPCFVRAEVEDGPAELAMLGVSRLASTRTHLRRATGSGSRAARARRSSGVPDGAGTHARIRLRPP